MIALEQQLDGGVAMENHRMTEYSGLPRGTMALVSKRVRSTPEVQDYVNWAVDALMDGLDSYSLAILAGLDIGSAVDWLEADKYFLKAVRELALPIPDDELALSLPNDEAVLRRHLNEIAQQIREGVIDPVTGIERIYREVISPLGHPSDLSPWDFLWEGNSPGWHYAEHSEEEHSEAIAAYATTWIEDMNSETRA
jgi:hypothetical protein